MVTLHTLITTIMICPVLVGYHAQAQQFYTGDAEAEVACNNSVSDIYRGYYIKDGPAKCKTNLTFRSQYPTNTLSKIASLLEVDTKDIAHVNPHYRTDDDIEWNKLVHVPVICTGDPNISAYYFKSTSHVVDLAETYFHLANNTYQGLVTCLAIRFMNGMEQDPSNFAIGKRLIIPLRCACPSIKQRSKGITSLLTYVVGKEDKISSISSELKVDMKSILEANGLSNDSVICPFTTLLIPVKNGEYGGSSTATPETANGSFFKGMIRASGEYNGLSRALGEDNGSSEAHSEDNGKIGTIVISVGAAIASVIGVVAAYLAWSRFSCCSNNKLIVGSGNYNG